MKNISNTLLSDKLSRVIDAESNTLSTRLYGTAEGSEFVEPLSMSSEGHLEVSIMEPRSAFGEVRVAVPTPVAQLDFVYGLNTNSSTTSVVGAGTVTATDGLLRCSSGTSSGDYGRLVSRRFLKYRPGQGSLARFTAVFGTPAANTRQIAGVGDDVDGYFFGYLGTSFGVLHRENSVDTWIDQANFTDDKLDGSAGSTNKSAITLDPTKGNVYAISMAYLGFGNIYFYVMNSIQGQWVLCHQLKYPNANTTPVVRNPSFALLWEARAFGTVSAVEVHAASGALFVDGVTPPLGNKWAYDNSKSSITTLTNIFTLRNNTTFGGIANKSLVRLQSLSVCSQGGNGVVTVYIVRGTTLGGSPSYTNLSTNVSIVAIDVAGTTVTGGQTVFNVVLNTGSNQLERIQDLDIYAAPGETLTFAAKSTASTTVAIACNWLDDV